MCHPAWVCLNLHFTCRQSSVYVVGALTLVTVHDTDTWPGWEPCRQSGCGDRGRHPDPGPWTRPPHYFVSKQGPVPHAAARTRPPLQFPAPYCRPTTYCSAAVLQGVIPSVNKDPCSTCPVPAQCGTHPNILHFHRREEGKLLFIFKNECLLSSVLHFHKMYIYLYKCVPSG